MKRILVAAMVAAVRKAERRGGEDAVSLTEAQKALIETIQKKGEEHES